MTEHDFWDLNWQSLRDAIAFVSWRFTVRAAEPILYDVLVSGDLPSILQRWTGERVVREPLTGWKEIGFSITSYADRPRELVRDDDIEIVRGLELLDPKLIFVWWPKVERLCGITVGQPEPAAQPEAKPQATPRRKGSRKQDLIKQFADENWPDGWELVPAGVVMKAADKDEEFKKKVGLPFPSRTTFARALGRRKD